MRSLTKFLAVPVAAAAIATAAAMAAPAAHAQTVNYDQNGTVALTIPLSYVHQLLKAHVIAFPVPLSEVSSNGQTVTMTFNVTGGNGDTSVYYGAVDLGGSFDIASVSGHFVSMGNLQLDVQDSEFVGTPTGSTTPVPLLDTSALIVTSTPSATTPGTYADTYEADSVTVDPDGATYLNNALHTKAFVAGQAVGTMNGSWSVVYPS